MKNARLLQYHFAWMHGCGCVVVRKFIESKLTVKSALESLARQLQVGSVKV
jgi:malate synthase